MIDKIFKIVFTFCLGSIGILALVYAFVILLTTILAVFNPPDIPYCDEVQITSPRPVGMARQCKEREKPLKKPLKVIRNGLILEF